jgi:hypothetical protein
MSLDGPEQGARNGRKALARAPNPTAPRYPKDKVDRLLDNLKLSRDSRRSRENLTLL